MDESMSRIIFKKLSVIFFFLSIMPCAYADSSYIEFAQAQAAKLASMTAPYQADIHQIKNHVNAQQKSIEINHFIHDIAAIPKKLFPTTTIKESSESIFIFVSFSMPKTSLQQWLAQAHRIGASVVLRGLIHNSFKDTLSAMTSLVPDNTGGLLLDPTLFQKFDIKQVPAVVISKPSACSNEQSCLPRFDVIYGDVTLDYALQQLQDKGNLASSPLISVNQRGEERDV